ncbi:MAG: hypothetical protein MSD82_07705 [Prevotella sp.]|nr:hypothetical protein [Prevotella sp.]
MKTKVLLCCWMMLAVACSSESVALEGVSAYDVQASPCKTSLSAADTRPDFYAATMAKLTTLRLTLGADGVTEGLLEDLMDNCVVGQFHVSAACRDGRIVLVVYPEVDAATDCVCVYDIGFKIGKLLPDSYELEVYRGRADGQYAGKTPLCTAPIRLETGRPVVLTFP